MVWLIAILLVQLSLVNADQNYLKGNWNVACDNISLGK